MRNLLISIFIALFGIAGFGIFISAPAKAESSNGSSTIVVQPILGPTIAEKVTERAKGSWPWYVTRATGLVAAVSLVILMVSGIGQMTGFMYRFLQPLTAWASHRALGIIFGVSVILHVVSILFDHFIPFTIAELLVPWLSHYKPVTILGVNVGSLYVALGILAFYGVIIVVLTSLLWVEKKPHTWKLLHLLSYIIMAFVFVHALFLGTDLMHGVLRYIWIGSGVLLIAAAIHRLLRVRTT